MSNPDTTVPAGASGEYRDFMGQDTWIKDLDLRNPNWPLAYVWSKKTRRWRVQREKIAMDRLRLFEVQS